LAAVKKVHKLFHSSTYLCLVQLIGKINKLFLASLLIFCSFDYLIIIIFWMWMVLYRKNLMEFAVLERTLEFMSWCSLSRQYCFHDNYKKACSFLGKIVSETWFLVMH
jgi:hypothetical protein